MDNSSDTPPEAQQDKPGSIFKIIITRVMVPGLITLAGVLIAFTLFKTRPVTETAPPKRTARLVETILVSPSSYTVEIEAMGLVEAKNQIDLRSRVSGEIISISEQLIPGHTLSKDDILFKVDPSDYELLVTAQEASFQQAKANLMLEKGQQLIAKTDYELTQNVLQGDELDLVLRKPQLLQAEASIKAAEASLNSAKLNLSRTEIKAPFDALVMERTASLGTVINTSTNLATLADSSEFWVELTIPVRDSVWIGLSEHPSNDDTPIEVTIIDQLAWKKGQFRNGKVVGLSREVDSGSRMAKVVVGVKDPLALDASNMGKPSLLLGSFVRGIIKGKELDDVFVVRRDYLRQGDILWTVDEDSRLEFHEVDVLYSGTENVVIKNDFDSELRVVTSNLPVPVEGMLVRYEGGPGVGPTSPTGSGQGRGQGQAGMNKPNAGQ